MKCSDLKSSIEFLILTPAPARNSATVNRRKTPTRMRPWEPAISSSASEDQHFDTFDAGKATCYDPISDYEFMNTYESFESRERPGGGSVLAPRSGGDFSYQTLLELKDVNSK